MYIIDLQQLRVLNGVKNPKDGLLFEFVNSKEEAIRYLINTKLEILNNTKEALLGNRVTGRDILYAEILMQKLEECSIVTAKDAISFCLLTPNIDIIVKAKKVEGTAKLKGVIHSDAEMSELNRITQEYREDILRLLNEHDNDLKEVLYEWNYGYFKQNMFERSTVLPGLLGSDIESVILHNSGNTDDPSLDMTRANEVIANWIQDNTKTVESDLGRQRVAVVAPDERRAYTNEMVQGHVIEQALRDAKRSLDLSYNDWCDAYTEQFNSIPETVFKKLKGEFSLELIQFKWDYLTEGETSPIAQWTKESHETYTKLSKELKEDIKEASTDVLEDRVTVLLKEAIYRFDTDSKFWQDERYRIFEEIPKVVHEALEGKFDLVYIEEKFMKLVSEGGTDRCL